MLSVRDQIAVRVGEWLLRGHKVHSQDQKEKNGCGFDFSLGKFHFCDLILFWFMLRLSNNDMNRGSRDKYGLFFSALEIQRYVLAVRLCSASTKLPEGTSSAQQLSIGKIKGKNEFKKIRNAETGKLRKQKDGYCNVLACCEIHSEPGGVRECAERQYALAIKHSSGDWLRRRNHA
jgi:hypothetical protein